jgi:hypothetical protein
MNASQHDATDSKSPGSATAARIRDEIETDNTLPPNEPGDDASALVAPTTPETDPK